MMPTDDPIETGLRRLGLDISPLLRYVLALVCLGYTDTEISEVLSVSRRTASNYVARLFAATHTTSRTTLVAEVLSGLKLVKRSSRIAQNAWLGDLITTQRAKP